MKFRRPQDPEQRRAVTDGRKNPSLSSKDELKAPKML